MWRTGVAGLLGLLFSIAQAAAQPTNVLVVYANNRLLPANIEVDRGLTENRGPVAGRPLRFFSEFLDAPLFGGQAFESRMADWLRDKYAPYAPSVIVAGGGNALDFLLRYRNRMFPDAPIVHVGVDAEYFATHPVPKDVLGTAATYDGPGTLDLALALHPAAKRLVVVTGASDWDRRWHDVLRAAIDARAPALAVEYLQGQRTDAVDARLAALGGDAIVITPGYFIDGGARSFTPRETIERMATVSRAPLYVLYASQLGTGAVGGRVASYADMGRGARALVDRLVAGEAPSVIRAPERLPAPPQVDWRQVHRWNIDERRLPADTVVHFRAPTFWEAYRTQAIVALVVMLVQAALIAALLLQRRMRRRTAAALEDSERHMRLAAQAARLSMFEWDLARDRAWSHAQLRTPAGLSREPPENLAQVLETVHPHDRERVEHAIRGIVEHGARDLDVEYRTRSPAGEVRWFAVRGHVTADDAQTIAGVKMDVTARKTAESQAASDRAALTHLSRISTMGQLSAAIAHQLNQPLAAILGNAETARKMLARPGASTEELREILDDIVTEDHRAADVIRRLGALYRRGETDIASIDLNGLVRETLDLLRTELTTRQVRTAVELDPGLPTVSGSRIQLQQVLLNLLLNAADAMALVDPSQRIVTIRTSTQGRLAQVSVADAGTGIAPADLARVFDPFFTTKTHGIGVGLAICRAIVVAHHGELVAENREGGGATFRFALPIEAAPE